MRSMLELEAYAGDDATDSDILLLMFGGYD
jgi:hypothetical protein